MANGISKQEVLWEQLENKTTTNDVCELLAWLLIDLKTFTLKIAPHSVVRRSLFCGTRLTHFCCASLRTCNRELVDRVITFDLTMFSKWIIWMTVAFHRRERRLELFMLTMVVA